MHAHINIGDAKSMRYMQYLALIRLRFLSPSEIGEMSEKEFGEPLAEYGSRPPKNANYRDASLRRRM